MGGLGIEAKRDGKGAREGRACHHGTEEKTRFMRGRCPTADSSHLIRVSHWGFIDSSLYGLRVRITQVLLLLLCSSTAEAMRPG